MGAMLLSTLTLESCITVLIDFQKDAKKDIDMFFSLQTVHASEGRFRTDGIYVEAIGENCDSLCFDNWIYLFTEDGTFVISSLTDHMLVRDAQQRADFDASVKKWGRKKRWEGEAGPYQVRGDTIFVHSHHRMGVEWFQPRRCFLIQNEESLRLLPSKWSTDTAQRVFRFVPCTNIPEAHPYIKKKKWMWKNENEWREYKRRQKHKTDAPHMSNFQSIH